MKVKHTKTGIKERLQELFVQKEYLENIEFEFVSEEVIGVAIEKVKEEINRNLKKLK